MPRRVFVAMAMLATLRLSSSFLPKIRPASSARFARHAATMTATKDQTALLLIEYQNEFCKENGALYPAVKSEMERTKMLQNTMNLVEEARRKGVQIIHAPITFKDDHSDIPQSDFGILKNIKEGGLFKASAWGGQIIDEMRPQEGDLVVEGKKGLDAFPGSNLESLLQSKGIKRLAIGGFLTNCCVESTMRTAYEKGYQVVTLTDCTAATSEAEFKAAAEGTWNMFSTPQTSKEFMQSVSD